MTIINDKHLYRKALPTSDTPFENDIFGRKLVAEQLTQYIDRLNDGAVIAIDAQWGDGKTWFANEWQKQLKTTDRKTIYIDAFKHDYIEDPFVMIAAELNKVFEKDEPEISKTLLENGKKVCKLILPAASKMITGYLSEKIGENTIDELGDLFNEAASKAIDKQLDEYEKNQESIEHFKKTLNELAKKQPNPIVIMIDELDRCKPTFAIKMIERIKHFFDVPNVVFVLFINRIQLEAAINNVYGCDARAYLGKFINLWFGLPKGKSTNVVYSFNYTFCNEVLVKRYNTPQNNNVSEFLVSMSEFANLYDFSFRDLEQAFILYNLQPLNASSTFIPWLIVLKMKFPDMFAKIIQNDMNVHYELAEMLSQQQKNLPDFYHLVFFKEVHLAHYNNTFDNLSPEVRQILRRFGNVYASQELLPSLAKKLDLQIDT